MDFPVEMQAFWVNAGDVGPCGRGLVARNTYADVIICILNVPQIITYWKNHPQAVVLLEEVRPHFASLLPLRGTDLFYILLL